MKNSYSIGLDYGTNTVRGVLIRLRDGSEMASAIYAYEHGTAGIILNPKDHNVARQHPQDYITGLETVLSKLMAQAKKLKISADSIIGIGIDTTGSTPIPVDKNNTPLAMLPRFKKNINALAWLWKDHTGYKEAAEITRVAAAQRPQYIAKCGNTYSSEWFFSKILHCLNSDEKVFNAAYSWVECCDFIPAWLCGITDPMAIKRSVCAAGHKALYHPSWNGLPDKEFLSVLNPKLADLRDRLFSIAYPSNALAGCVSDRYLKKFGFKHKVPVAVGAFDAHFGAVGAGVRPGVLVKIIGTSTCDITIATQAQEVTDIPGVCGVVPDSVVPGTVGIEAGQSAVGDILNWYVSHICQENDSYHAILTAGAAKLAVGQSGLLALDWNNGNRTVLVNPNLTGTLIGQTLHTTRAEIYRALIEATAFGARKIIERIQEYGINLEKVVNCGGISQKNAMFMQIYADVTGIPMEISQSTQTCALGSAIFAAVAGGAFTSVEEAQKSMCKANNKSYKPDPKRAALYNRLYELYTVLHDAFGLEQESSLSGVMAELLEIKRLAK